MVRLRVVDPEMPVPSETLLPLLSNHEMVGVGLPNTLLAHMRVMSPPLRIARRLSPSVLLIINCGGLPEIKNGPVVTLPIQRRSSVAFTPLNVVYTAK